MSAQIPETMLLSDLLKPTGYDCPEDLQGKTFEEATTGGDAKISTNTNATIDVSAYTEPVEVKPAEDYDATKKVTVALTNIPSPSGGSATAYAWTTPGRNPFWFEFDKAPADKAALEAAKYLSIAITDGTASAISISTDFFAGSTYTYTRDSDTQFTVNIGGTDTVFTRDSSKDCTLWG